MFAGWLEVVNGILRVRTRIRGVRSVDSNVGVYSTSLADYRKLISCVAVGSKVERGSDALGGFRCVFMLAGCVVRVRLWAFALRWRMIDEDVGFGGFGVEGEEVLV